MPEPKIPTDAEVAHAGETIKALIKQATTTNFCGRVGDLADAAFVLAAAYAAVLAASSTGGVPRERLANACTEGSQLGIKMIVKGALVLVQPTNTPAPAGVQ